jgi:hypothetical protein
MPFSSLDLTNDDIQTGRGLRAGVYRCVSKDAKWESKDPTREAVIVTFEDLEGNGQRTHYFNYKNPSAKAAEIGRSQLKTFATYGGHQDPNHLGKYGVDALNGLKCIVHVIQRGTYEKDGKSYPNFEIVQFAEDNENVRTGPTEPVGGGAPMNGAGAPPPSTGPSSMDDEIPF